MGKLSWTRSHTRTKDIQGQGARSAITPTLARSEPPAVTTLVPALPLRWCYMVPSWSANSCYVDAPLVLFETLQRGLRRQVKPMLKLPAPFDHNVSKDGALMHVDLRTPLRRWWDLREALRAGSIASELGAQQQQQQLAQARDDVRRAYSITQVNRVRARTAADAQRQIGNAMKRFGTASTVFNLMLSDPATKPRVEVKEVTDDILYQSSGDAFTACISRWFEGGARRAITPPDAIILNLPDTNPASTSRTISLGACVREAPLLTTSYRLYGVLMYSFGYHFIADAYDPDEDHWVRFDANSNDGIGQPIDPPTGLALHEEFSYFATTLLYVRV